MQKRVLITYFTESGSTSEAANIIKNKMKETANIRVDICDVERVDSVREYDLVVVGTPNWYGKPVPKITEFLNVHKDILKDVETSIYYTCMSLSEIKNEAIDNISFFKDPILKAKPKSLKEMSMWEKSHAISYYLTNLNNVASDFSPKNIAFFKGNLNFSRLSFSHRLIMKLITLLIKDVNEGDYLSKATIDRWVESQLSTLVVIEEE